MVAAFLLAACAGDTVRPSVRVSDDDIVLAGDRPLRALALEVTWEPGVAFNTVVAGPAAPYLNLVRARVAPDGRSARILVSDTRGLLLPSHGALVTVDASGPVRLVSAEGAEDGTDGPRTVAIEVRE